MIKMKTEDGQPAKETSIQQQANAGTWKLALRSPENFIGITGAVPISSHATSDYER
ncbi:unnamed protein product, partial [marine sediment metagenome]